MTVNATKLTYFFILSDLKMVTWEEDVIADGSKETISFCDKSKTWRFGSEVTRIPRSICFSLFRLSINSSKPPCNFCLITGPSGGLIRKEGTEFKSLAVYNRSRK